MQQLSSGVASSTGALRGVLLTRWGCLGSVHPDCSTSRAAASGWRRSGACVSATHGGSSGATSLTTSEVREVIRTDGRLETFTKHYSSATATAAAAAPTPATQERSSGHAGSSHQTTAHAPSGHTAAPAAAAGPALPPTAPNVPPMSEATIEQLVEAVEAARNVLVITGAGCSTESGVPDYRGPQGAYTKSGFKPMTHQQFMAGPAQQARYFARSFFGWAEFAGSRPGGAHAGLARLVNNGWVSHIITQNVDRLHHAAGTPPAKVLELHGTTHEVQCLQCGTLTCRHKLQHKLASLNPAAAEMAEVLQRSPGTRMASTGTGSVQAGALQQALGAGAERKERPAQVPLNAVQVPVRRPDGDVELQDAGHGFVVPGCDSCGGTLKPHVVFFGDNIPKERSQRSIELAAQSDLVLVVGSSLQVYSAYRLVEAAKKAGAKVVLLNVGPTRADPIADMKFEVLAGEAMMRLASHPRLLLPRI